MFFRWDGRFSTLNASTLVCGTVWSTCLKYFADAEFDPMPPMLVPLEWGKVKQFFEGEVRRLMEELL